VTFVETDSLVVRVVEIGESDVVVTLVTEQLGKVAALARGARKSSRRMAGSLEPLHTIRVLLQDKGRDLATLKEARVVRLRPTLMADLDSIEAAGIALRWARHLFPLHTREPQGWHVLIDLLDRLDGRGASASPRRELARSGLALLAAVGYGLDLARCVKCGRSCPEDKAACVDPGRGGLVCRSCGGAHDVLGPSTRRDARALSDGDVDEISDGSAGAILDLVDRAMAAHTGFER
jgi:DNA repair protein RecO (recombination protein O)